MADWKYIKDEEIRSLLEAKFDMHDIRKTSKGWILRNAPSGPIERAKSRDKVRYLDPADGKEKVAGFSWGQPVGGGMLSFGQLIDGSTNKIPAIAMLKFVFGTDLEQARELYEINVDDWNQTRPIR